MPILTRAVAAPGVTTGGGGGGSRVFGEQPGGTINGVNTVFTTSVDFTAGTEAVFLNGIRLLSGAGNDYTVTAADEITLSIAPRAGDIIQVDYEPA